MSKYRIKAKLNSYEVQRRGWFGWKNCISSLVLDRCYTKIFDSYAAAKQALENRIVRDTEMDELRRRIKEFGTKYYYPPLPDEEPTE